MKRQAGFTLLEILMVLTLLGVLLSLVAGAILGANRAVAKAQRFAGQLDEVRAAQNFLRVAISHALPLGIPDEQHHKPVIFVGGPAAMTFYGPLPTSLGGGLHQQRVQWADQRLQVDFARLGEHGTQPFGEPQVLLRRVQRVQFSYRGSDPKGQPTAWLSEWPWPSRLPRAVRIDASLGGGAKWVLQQVALRLDLSGEAHASDGLTP